MPFNKQTARQAGKKSSRKNVPNVTTKRTKGFIVDFLEDDQELALQDWKKLEPRDRWNIRTRLMEFVTPKMQRSAMSIDLSRLSDHEVNEMFSRALKMAEDER